MSTMSRVLMENLPPGTTIRDIDEFCSPYGRLLYVNVKIQGKATLACIEYENLRNALNLVRARHGHNFNGYYVQLKLMDDSGPSEIRNDTRQQNQMPAWSNNQVFNNGIQGMSSSNYGGNNLGGNTYNNNCGPLSLDNSLDFNDVCRIVFDRLLQEGYNRQVAKEKTLDFVTNMQRSSGRGFNNSNSNYFGSEQDMMNSNCNFNNGNQNWGGGGGNTYGDGYSNSNWGSSLNGLTNQQIPSAGGGLNRGGTAYQQRLVGRNNGNVVPSSSIRNGGGARNNNGMANSAKTEPNTIDDKGAQYDRYFQSLQVRKKIEARIKSGKKTVPDLKTLQFHNRIISEYEEKVRQQKKDVQLQLQRYKSALGTVLTLGKRDQSQITDDDKKTLLSSKAIVERYERTIANKSSQYKRKKMQLLKQSTKNYPNGFKLTELAKSRMQLLRNAGIDMADSKLLALHSSTVVQQLIDLKNSVPASAATAEADILGKKIKSGCQSANKVLKKHENSDLASLTEKEKAVIRISLRRLRSYSLIEGKEIPTTRFDVLLTETPNEKPPPKNVPTKAATKTEVDKKDKKEKSDNSANENDDQEGEELETADVEVEFAMEEEGGFEEDGEVEEVCEEEQMDEEEQEKEQ